ncbi:MAG: helix-turn-helix domain-containing protein [Patescibacteria group bacterium]|jgi:sugar-specific transcriptional regulator TrmB
MLVSTLKQIGLEEKQAKIYLACLELGETSIKEIAKKSGIKRTSIYDIIDEMVNAGLIKVTTKVKKKKFIASEPEELKTIIKKREALLDQIMPQLGLINNSGLIKPKVWFYEGVSGLKKVYDDTLEYKDHVIYQWASNDMFDAIESDWIFDYVKRRVKAKIKALCIATNTPEIREFKSNDVAQLREIRMVPKESFPFKIELDVYGNRVAMISGRDKIGVIIESESIASTLKMIFKLCWENVKQ